MNAFDNVKVKSLKALHDWVLVSDMNFEERVTDSGIILQSLDKKLEGVHPRWARVYAIGDKQQDIKIGQYILVKHGRWTRGVTIENDQGDVKTIRRVDPNDILLVSNEPMSDENIGEGL